ncbi:MAG: hypothetical protein ACHQAX_10005, partial [Gammaproteobacteria bacterium]
MKRIVTLYFSVLALILIIVLPSHAKTIVAMCSNFEAFQTDYITEKKQPDDKPTLKKFDDKKTKLLSKELVVLWQPGNNKAKFKFKE